MNKIFCIWSGDNEMSENRKACLQTLRTHCSSEVVLVNQQNINDYILDDYPIHPTYKYLSYTHRCDYLRSYLMYHYGGGYTDIKHNKFSWISFFDTINNTNRQMVGYAELRSADIASNNPNIRNAFRSLPGMGHFLFRKYSNIAKEWTSTVNNILDTKSEQIIKNPGTYHPRAIYGGVFQSKGFEGSQYPLGWNEILGSVLHPIFYKNIGDYELTMPYPQMSNYR